MHGSRNPCLGVQARRPENSQRGFFLGGGGGGGSVLNLFYSLHFTEGSNGFITEKTILSQGSRGGPTFSRGAQMLISIETHITCDFSGDEGSRPHIQALDPHMLRPLNLLGNNLYDIDKNENHMNQ